MARLGSYFCRRVHVSLVVAETRSAVAALAREQSILSLCDNTVATPLAEQPIELGMDLVARSATKYIGGHHDLLAGAVCGSKALVIVGNQSG